jgi:hypothetical protein
MRVVQRSATSRWEKLNFGPNHQYALPDTPPPLFSQVEPDTIVSIYRDLIIPMTKDVEILYLFQRSGYPCPPLDHIHDI